MQKKEALSRSRVQNAHTLACCCRIFSPRLSSSSLVFSSSVLRRSFLLSWTRARYASSSFDRRSWWRAWRVRGQEGARREGQLMSCRNAMRLEARMRQWAHSAQVERMEEANKTPPSAAEPARGRACRRFVSSLRSLRCSRLWKFITASVRILRALYTCRGGRRSTFARHSRNSHTQCGVMKRGRTTEPAQRSAGRRRRSVMKSQALAHAFWICVGFASRAWRKYLRRWSWWSDAARRNCRRCEMAACRSALNCIVRACSIWGNHTREEAGKGACQRIVQYLVQNDGVDSEGQSGVAHSGARRGAPVEPESRVPWLSGPVGGILAVVDDARKGGQISAKKAAAQRTAWDFWGQPGHISISLA